MFLSRHALLGATVLAACAISLNQPAQAAVAAKDVTEFDVPAQDLASALNQVAKQANIHIAFPGEVVANRQSLHLKGRMSAAEAVHRLVAKLGLRVVQVSDGSILVTRGAGPTPMHRAGGQSSHGAIIGRVLDPATGEYQQNAAVTIETADGRTQTLVSGAGGEFRVPDAPAGTARITVRFEGYEDEVTTLTVVAKDTLRPTINLRHRDRDVAGKSGDIVVIAGVRDGDARAIQRQRQSMNIVDALSSESFGEIPEGNIGEFLRFMPGVSAASTTYDGTARYIQLRGLPPEMTAVYVDGRRVASADSNATVSGARAFSFEQMGLSSIDSIEIRKTVSADLDADAPAGVVNLVTKHAFDRKGRRIVVSLSGVSNTDQWDSRRSGPGEDGSKGWISPNARVEYSDIFLNGRLGVVAGASFSQAYSEYEIINTGRNYIPTAKSPQPLAVSSIDNNFYTSRTNRFASNLTVDFKASDNLVLSLNALYNRTYINLDQIDIALTTNARSQGVTGDPTLDFTTLSPTGSNYALTSSSVLSAKTGRGYTFTPHFEWHGNHMKLDGYFSYSNATSRFDPMGEEGSIFTMLNNPRATGTFSASRPGLLDNDWTYIQQSGADWADPRAFTKTGQLGFVTQDGRSSESQYQQAGLNLEFDAPWGIPIVFKTGYKWQKLTYDYQNLRQTGVYNYTGPLSSDDFLAQFATRQQVNFNGSGIDFSTFGGSNSPYIYSTYAMGRFFKEHPDQFTYVMTPTYWYNSYVANPRHYEEELNAAYLMGTAKLGSHLMLRAGLRWERTETGDRQFDPLTGAELKAAGYAYSASTGLATTVDGLKYQFLTNPRIMRRGQYDNFFPSASLKWSIDRATEFQVGYSNTINRPPISAIAGVWSVNDTTQTVTAPNPNLQPQKSDNLSIRLAHYFGHVGFLAANYYQNWITGLFVSQSIPAQDFGYTGEDYSNYTFKTTINSPGGATTVKGVELEWIKALNFLPKPLSGLTVRGSYTYTQTSQLVEGVANHTVNAGLAYQDRRFRMNLNTQYRSDEIYDGTTGAYIRPRFIGSLSGSYQFRRGLQATFAFNNLFYSPLNVVRPGGDYGNGQVPDHTAYTYTRGRTVSLGARATF